MRSGGSGPNRANTRPVKAASSSSPVSRHSLASCQAASSTFLLHAKKYDTALLLITIEFKGSVIPWLKLQNAKVDFHKSGHQTQPIDSIE